MDNLSLTLGKPPTSLFTDEKKNVYNSLGVPHYILYEAER